DTGGSKPARRYPLRARDAGARLARSRRRIALPQAASVVCVLVQLPSGEKIGRDDGRRGTDGLHDALYGPRPLFQPGAPFLEEKPLHLCSVRLVTRPVHEYHVTRKNICTAGIQISTGTRFDHESPARVVAKSAGGLDVVAERRIRTVAHISRTIHLPHHEHAVFI